MILKFLINLFARIFSRPTTPSPVVIPLLNSQDKIVEPPPAPDYLDLICLAIEDFEEYVVPGGIGRDGQKYPNGTKSWQCKNPGNIRDIHGVEMVFPTYDAGFACLKDYVTRAATGKHPAYKPTVTLMQFFHTYTGDPEPVPTNYAIFVGKRMGVDPHIFTISQIVS